MELTNQSTKKESTCVRDGETDAGWERVDRAADLLLKLLLDLPPHGLVFLLWRRGHLLEANEVAAADNREKQICAGVKMQ